MPPDSPPVAVPAPDIPESATSTPPGLIALFTAFARMSLAGFGGVLVFARRGIVEQHRWMTADEFNETFALCHFLPGPNIVNLSVGFGARFRGLAGGIAAFAGLIGAPVGLLISVVFRMMLPLVKRRDLVALVVMIAVFIAIGLARLPLPAVLLVAIPLSLAITIVARRRAAS